MVFQGLLALTGYWGYCIFSHSDGVNRSLLFDVFSLEVCADPLAHVSTSGGEKVNFFKSDALSGQNRLYLFEIAAMVGSDSNRAALLQAAQDLFEIGRAEEAPFVVAFFWPGVGKIDVETVN